MAIPPNVGMAMRTISLGKTPAMALELTQSVWSVLDYIRNPVHVSDYQLQEWAEQRNSIAKSAIETYKRE